ncbi:hypothetical protein DEI81_09645 [Curtobacterium sp. MCBD17_013]|nr:hypothetical protein DEI81_09645 [Curtobacterium sp. MCBD17_013]
MGLHPTASVACAVEAPETTLLTQTGSTTDAQRADTTTGAAARSTDIQFASRRERRAAEAAAARTGSAAPVAPVTVAATTAAASEQAIAEAAPAAEATLVAATEPAPKPAVAAGAAVVRSVDPELETPIAPVTSSFAKSPVATAARRAAASRAAVASSASRPAARGKRKVLPVAVMTITAGLFGTMALPAIAATAPQPTAGSQQAVAQGNLRSADSQSLTVANTAALADTVRDGYTATAPKVVAPKVTASTATTTTTTSDTALATARAQTAASYASYTGPSAADYVASPKYPSFSLSQVVSVAEQYIGTPYVYGGATPAGFDCSGYVMYVYAQFGISLAHSVPLQDAAGTTIPTSEAQPGDVVIFNTEAHEGFYMGNGMIMDAPKPGGSVSIRPIWTTDYHIVRFGIK